MVKCYISSIGNYGHVGEFFISGVIMIGRKSLYLVLAGIALVAVLSVFMLSDHEATASDTEPQAQQAMPVVVNLTAAEPVQIWKEYSARLVAIDYAEIRPQVSGTIQKIDFADGQIVNEGDVLFVIDPRPYEAAVSQAKAELSAAKNQEAFSLKELGRAKELIKTNAIPKRLLDERSNSYRVAQASVKAAQAILDRAELDLEYAHIKAPISGRISRAEIKIGNLVEAGASAPVLTSIVSTEGIYADFEVDEQSYLKYVRSVARELSAENKIAVRMHLSADTDIEYEGFIESFDNQIDASSGTIRARARFGNEDMALLPGMYANVEMGVAASGDKILVTERAIGTDQSRKFVYVVDDQDTVVYREVRIGESVAGKRVITSGLAPGEKVIVEGIIHIRPGMKVAPQIPNENVAEVVTEQSAE